MEPLPDRITREIEILGLKREARDAAGGEMTAYEAEDAPVEVLETFWQGVVDFEKSPWITHKEALAQDGVVLKRPDELDEAQLSEALESLIQELSTRRVYLSSTDHLSDRELYTWLWEEGFAEQYKAMPRGAGWNCHLDVVGSGSAEDTLLYMRYFASEQSRTDWMKDIPDYPMPPHEDPPYDRDRYLPQADYSLPEEWDLEI